MSGADKREGLKNHDPKIDILVAEHIFQPFSAVQVENTVSYINPDVTSGLESFTLGQPTNLAYQLALGSSRRRPDGIVWARELHNRSAILLANAKITIGNQVFNYLDAKGTGLLEDKHRDTKSADENRYTNYRVAATSKPHDHPYSEETSGLATQSWVDIDNSMSARLEFLGIRTVPIVAIADIGEVIDPNGNKISIAKAKERGYVAQGTEPVILYRAWVTPFRLTEALYRPEWDKEYGDITTTRETEKKRVIVRTAIADIQKDTSIPLEVRNSFSDISQYLRWLASTIGSNLGKMHRLGITHGFLYRLHNITLDGRFVDLDDMVENSSPKRIEDDRNSIFHPRDGYFFSAFLRGIPKLFDLNIDPKELLQLTKDSYYSSLGSSSPAPTSVI